MRARLTFLSGPHQGKRFIVDDDTITLKGDVSQAAHLPDAPAYGPLAVIIKADRGYSIAAQHPPALLTLNGIDIGDGRTRVLRDGDLIQLGDGQTARFGTVPDRQESAKPMRQIAQQSWHAARHLQARAARRGLFFLRDLCSCTARDASWGTRLWLGATFVALTLTFGLGGLSLIQAQAADRRVAALGAQVAAGSASHQRLEEHVARLRQLEQEKAGAEARLRDVSRHLETAEQRLAKLEKQTPDLLAAIETARRSVALIVVAYALYDKDSGSPLRFLSVDANDVPQANGSGTYETSTAGSGPIVTAYATGSGFVIERNRLVTNRHVVEPWREDASIQPMIDRGFEPRRTVAHAYFPRKSQPVALRMSAVSEVADIAVMTGAIPRGLPALTIAPSERRVSTGDLIFVVGYPTGFDALLARTDYAIAQQIVHGAGKDPAALANALAERDLISPLVTVGHIGDVLTNNIVYDAATTHGSSGGPVLNAGGEVVALNYAALEDFAGARFGIPVAMVHRLLRQPRRRAGL